MFEYETCDRNVVFYTDLEGTNEESSQAGKETNGREERKGKTKMILLTVGRKLIANPNTHATIIGLIWASVQYRYIMKHKMFNLVTFNLISGYKDLLFLCFYQMGSQITSNC